MRWIAPPERDTGTATLEQRLWDAADQLRANSGLTAQQYSQPVLGLIFLRFAEARFLALRKLLQVPASGRRRATRDLLLPRLMSGQLTLPEAGAAVPASL